MNRHVGTRSTQLFLSICAALLSSQVARANAVKIPTSSFWTVRKNVGGENPGYFAVSAPALVSPKSNSRTFTAVMVSYSDASDHHSEIEILPGFRFKEGSSAAIQLGSTKFPLHVQNVGGVGRARLQNASDERAITEQMARHSEMTVVGNSDKNVVFTETFRLRGFAEASQAARTKQFDVIVNRGPKSQILSPVPASEADAIEPLALANCTVEVPRDGWLSQYVTRMLSDQRFHYEASWVGDCPNGTASSPGVLLLTATDEQAAVICKIYHAIRVPVSRRTMAQNDYTSYNVGVMEFVWSDGRDYYNIRNGVTGRNAMHVGDLSSIPGWAQSAIRRSSREAL
jgi:hypothetical protein